MSVLLFWVLLRVFFFEKNLLPLHIKWRAGKGKQVLYDKRGSI